MDIDTSFKNFFIQKTIQYFHSALDTIKALTPHGCHLIYTY